MINALKRFPIFRDAVIPEQAHLSNVKRLTRLKPTLAAGRQGYRKETFEVELRWAAALDICVHYEGFIKSLSACGRANLVTFLAQWFQCPVTELADWQPAESIAADLEVDEGGGRLPWKLPEFRILQNPAVRQRRARIIAFCGLDGSGKSSLIGRLRDDPGFNDAICVSKRLGENCDSVLEVYSDTEQAPDDYLRGSFAEASRWAYAFDFLRFYEEEVLPHLGRDVLIVSDRWSPCAISYAEAGMGLGDEIHELLSCVPLPDLTIYLDVSPQEAVRRILKRGGQDKGEHVDILRCCADAYENWWPKLSSPETRVERVINDDFESAYRRVVALIEQIS